MAMDLDLALRAMGGDRQLLEQLAQTVSEDSPRIALEFRESLLRQDFASARIAVHSLKGLMASFYEPRSVETFAKYERLCAEENWDALQGAADYVTQCIASLLNEMREQGLIDKSTIGSQTAESHKGNL